MGSSELTNGNAVFPLRRPSIEANTNSAHRQGIAALALPRALAVGAPVRPRPVCQGRLPREHGLRTHLIHHPAATHTFCRT
jgi:hypothetical protein